MALTTEAKMALAYYAGDTALGKPDYAMVRALIAGSYLTAAGVITTKGLKVIGRG